MCSSCQMVETFVFLTVIQPICKILSSWVLFQLSAEITVKTLTESQSWELCLSVVDAASNKALGFHGGSKVMSVFSVQFPIHRSVREWVLLLLEYIGEIRTNIGSHRCCSPCSPCLGNNSHLSANKNERCKLQYHNTRNQTPRYISQIISFGLAT